MTERVVEVCLIWFFDSCH